MGYKRTSHEKTSVKKYEFVYDEEYDRYICPKTGVKLKHSGTISRDGYKRILQ